MASVSLQGRGNINEIANILIEEVKKSGLTCELIDSSQRNIAGSSSILLVFEKYYMRTSNRASLSIMLNNDSDTIYVDAISSGGGESALFRFSWGAEENFVGIVPQILSSRGFS